MTGVFKSAVLRSIVLGVILGLLVNVVSFGFDVSSYLSNAHTFDQIHIGDSRSKALEVLQKDRIWCDLTSGSRFCRFSDFWRDYEIGTDSANRIVTSKYMVEREHRTFLSKLAGVER
jgi:hypothetical protein